MRQSSIYAKDVAFFDSAIELANYGEHRVRVGCVAAVNGKRVAGAFNTYRNRPDLGYGNATYHAEFNVIRQIPYRLIKKATIYVARINVMGGPVPSYPCERCRDNMMLAGVADFVYLDKNSKLVKEKIH